MRKNGIILLLTVLSGWQVFAYNDHRGHNLDSLEREVGRWTPQAVDGASDEQLYHLNRACRDLMLGYEVINGEKAVFYARKAIAISRRKGSQKTMAAIISTKDTRKLSVSSVPIVSLTSCIFFAPTSWAM